MGRASTKNLPAAPAQAGLPAYLQGQKGLGSGLQGLDTNDFVVPRIILLQGVSDQVTTFDNAKAGEFWLNVLDVPLGKALDFTPVLNRKRFMLLAPREDGKGVLARADDGKTWRPDSGRWSIKLKGVREPVTWEITDPDVRKSGLAEFGSANPGDPDSNPAATLFYDYLVLVHGVAEIEGTPVMLSLARSAAKKARDLNGKIGFGSAPMQSRVFRAAPTPDKNTSGDEFWNWQFASNGFVDEATYNLAMAQAERFGALNFRGAGDEVDDADTAAAQSGGATGSGEY